LEAWFYRKLVVLRNLEAKLQKTDNLRGLICEIEPDAPPRIYLENKTPKDRLTHGEK
jgi:hypothetical protein